MSIVAYANSTLLTYILSYKLLKSQFTIYRKDVIDIHFYYTYIDCYMKLSDFIYKFLFTYLKSKNNLYICSQVSGGKTKIWISSENQIVLNLEQYLENIKHHVSLLQTGSCCLSA